ncbi:MAG: hypothetical protein QOF35_1818 [Actinomycetota bacterium]|nr:hypothetical protein [Actinomycetota bacterium]
MGAIAIERIIAAPPPKVWDIITDWAGYGRWMPLTTMRVQQGPPHVGWSFAGLTGVGRLRFSDEMRITAWEPPSEAGQGVFAVVKVGRVLAGWAKVSVLPTAGGANTRLLWRESIVVRPAPLGRLLSPLTDRLSKALFARVVDAMAAEAVRASGRL